MEIMDGKNLSNIIKELLLNLSINSFNTSILEQEILALRLTVLLDNCLVLITTERL